MSNLSASAGDLSDPKPAPDLQLLGSIASGDEDALLALYDRYSRIVYSVLLRVVRDVGAAEELLQDIFLQLWRCPRRFDSARGNLGAWLATVARHRGIDHLRRQRSTDTIENANVGSIGGQQHFVETSEAMNKVARLLPQLTPEQREVLQLAFFDGLTHIEISQRTGRPLGTVKTQIRGAVITLRKMMIGNAA